LGQVGVGLNDFVHPINIISVELIEMRLQHLMLHLVFQLAVKREKDGEEDIERCLEGNSERGEEK